MAAALAAGELSAASASTAAAGPQTAQSCYGSAKSYSKPAGDRWVPNNGSTSFLTTSNCNDINIKPNTTTTIAVCFLPSSGGWSCQTSFKTAPAGQWTVVATDVLDNTRFIFDFGHTSANTGVWAG
ncbi:hypothetical protein [Streptomyces odonnellii]|uniref:hypothetical protein n=1 Tax=Streptomyces odonnellii TaxID=1417980 RepID=UPI000626B56E|nr:hypothetical protein [Streptomyces odonnellii]